MRYLVIVLVALSVCNSLLSTQTSIYVHNNTHFEFDVLLKYEGALFLGLNNIGAKNLMPYNISSQPEPIINIPRFLPVGEHLFTIKLHSGTEDINFKQKLISKNDKSPSELGITVESICMRQPWVMNDQAKYTHQQIISFGGTMIVVTYYIKDQNDHEDIIYTLAELTSSQELYCKGNSYHKYINKLFEHNHNYLL